MHIKALMESRFSGNGMIPDQVMIVQGQGSGADYVGAIRSEASALFYIPTGAGLRSN